MGKKIPHSICLGIPNPTWKFKFRIEKSQPIESTASPCIMGYDMDWEGYATLLSTNANK